MNGILVIGLALLGAYSLLYWLARARCSCCRRLELKCEVCGEWYCAECFPHTYLHSQCPECGLGVCMRCGNCHRDCVAAEDYCAEEVRP